MIPLDGPIKNEIVFETASVIKLFEHSSEVIVVWILGEAKISAVVHVIGELLGISFC